MTPSKRTYYIRKALALQEIYITPIDLEQIIETTDVVTRKKGKTSLKDASVLQEKYNTLRNRKVKTEREDD